MKSWTSIPELVKPFCWRCGDTGAAVGLCCWLLPSDAVSTTCVSPLDDKLSVPKKEPGPAAPDVCVGDTNGPGATVDCAEVTAPCWEVSVLGVPLVGDATVCTKPWPAAPAAPEAEDNTRYVSMVFMHILRESLIKQAKHKIIWHYSTIQIA